jgi:soluble lytic murein transglycosylase
VLGATVVVVVAMTGKGDPPWQRWIDRVRYPLHYEAVVRDSARRNELDPALLAAVIYTESKFHSDARSDSGAVGLMQLMPRTARTIAARTGGIDFRVADLDDPDVNVRYGAWYLRYLLDRYGDEETALAAYNAGQSAVDVWRRRGVGIQFSETRAYVAKVEHVKRVYRRTYSELGE